MIRKLMSPVCGLVRVTFELPSCLWADRIYVTGDFNGWSHTATPMRQGRDGVWRVSLDLQAGRQYEFRYLIDGKWQTDHHADGWQDNRYGSENSVVDTGLLAVEPVREAGAGSLLREGAAAAAIPAAIAATRPPQARPAKRDLRVAA